MSDLSPAERYTAFRSQSRSAAEHPELTRFREVIGFELDDFQVQACEALEQGRAVLVAAPTGAGKTVVGEFAVHLALASGRKAFYTTPIKALSNQKYADLVRRHGIDNVGLLTGDTTINGDAPVVVMTTEVLRNMLYAGSSTLDGLAYVVMDEVHYLADRFRGPVWEEVIIHLSDDVQLVSLSATVSNAEEFGDWLEMVRGDTAVVVSERRPVPLWQHVLMSSQEPRGKPRLLDLYDGHVDPTDPGTNPPINPDLSAAFRSGRGGNRPGDYRGGPGGRRGRGAGRGRGYRGGDSRRSDDSSGGIGPSRRTPPRFIVIDALNADALLPAIYFVFSRAGCEAAVDQCLKAGLRLTTPQEEATIRSVVEERTTALPPEDLDVLGYWAWSQALARGVAAHHAGMLPVFKETVEDLFSRGLVKVVFATETLALGINMPARSVVLDKLVKWDGTSHVPVTPGEYTQLTGRAGRRGIDVEGHAVVVDHPALDPVALAGLASKRLYPLKSSFRPTYNMAVNLVAQVGRDRAREVLETSFAQFQADRGVVGLAKQAQAHAEALDGYAKAMSCDVGDFGEYMDLRRAIKDREKELSRAASGAERAEIVASLEQLRRGDVVEVPTGRRRGYVLVLDPGEPGGFDGPRPTVLTQERQVKKLTLADAPDGLETVTTVKIPKAFNPRKPDARRDLVSSMRNALGALADDVPSAHSTSTPAGQRVGAAARGGKARSDAGRTPPPTPSSPGCARPSRRTRATPAPSATTTPAGPNAGTSSSGSTTSSCAASRAAPGPSPAPSTAPSTCCSPSATCSAPTAAPGRTPGRSGSASPTTAAGCAACTPRTTCSWPSACAAACGTASTRQAWPPSSPPSCTSHDATTPPTRTSPAGRPGASAGVLDDTQRVWSEVDDLEEAHGIEATGPLDLGLVGAMYRWASGKGLDSVLRGSDLAAGDFVRWCKQVIDVLDQLGGAAPSDKLRTTARKAQDAVLRGVVAYSSL